MREILVKKYVLVFFITAGIFVLIFFFADFLYGQRIAQIKTTENNISRNILESEVQYALLADAPCDADETSSSILIDEINRLATRLSHLEEQRGGNDPEVTDLKKYYSLLQVKDYLLARERTKQCGQKPLFIIYFYSNRGDCTECTKMGFVLTSMRKDYDNLRVYAFDYDLGLSVIETLKTIYKLDGTLPALVIDRKPYYGFKTREEIEELLPGLAESRKSTTTEETI